MSHLVKSSLHKLTRCFVCNTRRRQWRGIGFLPPFVCVSVFFPHDISTSTSVFRDRRISTHADHTSTRRAISLTAHLYNVTYLYGNVYTRVGVARALADSSDFGLPGEQSSQKWEISCLGRRWTAVQNLTPLALSSAEKPVTVQTNTQTKKQTILAASVVIHTCRCS